MCFGDVDGESSCEKVIVDSRLGGGGVFYFVFSRGKGFSVG